jgi:hypothetical protein
MWVQLPLAAAPKPTSGCDLLDYQAVIRNHFCEGQKPVTPRSGNLDSHAGDSHDMDLGASLAAHFHLADGITQLDSTQATEGPLANNETSGGITYCTNRGYSITKSL